MEWYHGSCFEELPIQKAISAHPVLKWEEILTSNDGNVMHLFSIVTIPSLFFTKPINMQVFQIMASAVNLIVRIPTYVTCMQDLKVLCYDPTFFQKALKSIHVGLHLW